MLRSLFMRHRFHYWLVGLAEGHVSQKVTLCNRQCIYLVRQTSHQNSQKPPTALPELSKREKDVLAETINSAKSLNSVVDIAKSHHSIMNNKHIILTIHMLYKFLRESKGNISQEINVKDLNSLCGQIVKRARHFSPEECVTIFRTLTMLNVASNSAVMESICQMIRHGINDLPLGTLSFMDFLLQKHESTPLVDALKLSIPIVLQAQISTQLNPDNIAELIGCLNILSRFNSTSSTIEKLCEKIVPRCDNLNTSQALNVIITLNKMETKPENYRTTLASLVEVLNQNIHKLSPTEIKSFLYQLNRCAEISFSCPSLLSTLSREAKHSDWDLPMLCDLVDIFNKYKFISMEVLDLIAQKMSEKPQVVANDKHVSIVNLVKGFALADYQPGPFLNAVLDSKEKLQELKEQAPQVFITLVGHLALLDAASPEMIQSVCNEDFVTRVYENEKARGKNKNLLHYLNILNQYARLHLQNYDGSMLTQYFVEEAMKAREEYKTPTADATLQTFLEVGLGGPRFVLNGLWTRLGHFIDHVIVMRKGDFPIAINKISEEEDRSTLTYPKSDNGFRYIEDLVIPEDAKVLAVLVARRDWMANDPPKPTGWATFQQRSLTKMGYNSIIIHPKVVHSLLDREKVPYLMREINLVLRQGTVTSQCF